MYPFAEAPWEVGKIDEGGHGEIIWVILKGAF